MTANQSEKLVDRAGLLAALFDENTRPSIRTLDRWVKKKQIPCFRIGRFVRFDPAQVRQALERRCLVTSRADRTEARR